ncbi:MAG TPA: hypothetical protein VHZ55_05705 [Bryobacteraceae bacterium]|jgi:hypothetical protein|nr:hypothetical protein [Bryobacteraceae bacterium]
MKNDLGQHKPNELVHSERPKHTEPHMGHGGTSYEGGDASAGMVVGSLSVIGLTLVIVFALTIGIQKYIQQRNPIGPLASPLAPERVVPPAPQLQVQPWEDLPQMRAHEEQVLNSSGRDAQGHYHIPINDAMGSVVARLKVEPNAPVGLTTPGGGGRGYAGSLTNMPANSPAPAIRGEIEKHAQ